MDGKEGMHTILLKLIDSSDASYLECGYLAVMVLQRAQMEAGVYEARMLISIE